MNTQRFSSITNILTYAPLPIKAKRRIAGVGIIAIVWACSACFPGGMSMEGGSSTETGTASETGFDSGDGDGDGDPGDGDGDPACEGSTPVVTCSEASDCWASEPSWTAEARSTTAEAVALMLDAGVWVPSDLDVGDECWTLLGTDRHACTVDVCGTLLLGTPATELPLEPPGPECEFTGVWESTMSGFGLPCFGLIDGVAVELRSTAPSPCSFPLGPCPNNDCGVDGRRSIADIDCGADGCLGLWSGTDAWSTMIMADQLDGLPLANPGTLWPCEPAPDVDTCVVVDQNGHVGCFRIEGLFAVPVSPACAFEDASRVDAGNGMCSASDQEPMQPGEMWAPCPIADGGTITLCNSQTLACVPANGGDANACLPVGECPDGITTGFTGGLVLGFGGVCYPRCSGDTQCLPGQVCAVALADGESMCAWPA